MFGLPLLTTSIRNWWPAGNRRFPVLYIPCSLNLVTFELELSVSRRTQVPSDWVLTVSPRGDLFFYNSFLCSVIYRIVIRFSRWSCYSPPGSIRDFNRTHLDLWWFTIGQYGNRGVLYAFIISRTEKSTIHINFMISRVDRYMRRMTLQNARTCGGYCFRLNRANAKGWTSLL